ncbi:MAG TPA: endonuclease III [bacterium]|nr:endonuclease III [bacterium]
MSNSNTPAILKELKRLYPDVRCFLHYKTPFQLLCAVILSAQCTDERVNLVVPGLFKVFPTPEKLAKARIQDIEKLIKSTGFYHNKAKNLLGAAQALLALYKGKMPRTIEEMTAIPGVGRKTANVVLGEVYGISEGITVDTHVTRLSNRLGWTRHQDAVKIERDLMGIVPKEEWLHFSHRLIQHGRKVCDARKPLCGACTLAKWCPSAKI